MNKSESIKELATALAKAQSKLENASKNAKNEFFKGSKYADLAEVLNTVRPVFSENGLSIIQLPSFEAGIVHVETVLMHVSGEFVSGVTSAPVSKHDAQGVGSATTYCRRYGLAAIAGIAQEDDDANSATGKTGNYEETKGPKQATLISYEQALSLLDSCMDMTAVDRVGALINDSWGHFTNPQRKDLREKKNDVINSLTKGNTV